MGLESVTLQNLSIAVLGSIQPVRLRTLLLKSDNDGLTARFLTFWPNPAPIQRPCQQDDGSFLQAAYERLLSLELQQDEEGRLHPVVAPFTYLPDILRHETRGLEATADGILHSFIGKLPGLAIRVATVLIGRDRRGGAPRDPLRCHRQVYNLPERIRLAHGPHDLRRRQPAEIRKGCPAAF
jgi:hypothetical protein